MQVQTSHRGVVYSGTMAQSETAGAASSLSVGELKRALKALGAPPARLAACIERPDFEALHTELSAQAKTTNGTADREAYADSVEQEALRKAAAAAGSHGIVGLANCIEDKVATHRVLCTQTR